MILEYRILSQLQFRHEKSYSDVFHAVYVSQEEFNEAIDYLVGNDFVLINPENQTLSLKHFSSKKLYRKHIIIKIISVSGSIGGVVAAIASVILLLQ